MLSVVLENRYLLYELMWRDVRSRYVGSIIGLFWSILNPLMQLVLYTAVFSVILEVRLGEELSAANFAEFLFCALLPWIAFQESVTRSARCFIEQSNLIQKVRFPLEVIPLSLVLSAFFHQLLGTLIFLCVLIYDQALHIELLPLAIILFFFQILMMLGTSLIVACINVFFRDTAQMLGVLFMLLFWMTPIVYPRTRAPAAFQLLLDLNPLTHMVDGFRFAFLGSPDPALWGLLYWGAVCAALFGVGLFILARTRGELVDLV